MPFPALPGGDDRAARGVRLRPDWPALLSALPRLGPVCCVTPNRYASLRFDGNYPEYQHFGCRGLFVGETLDVRLGLPLLSTAFAIALRDGNRSTLKRSLHFCDNTGTMVHQVLLSTHSAIGAFEEILEEFVSPEQSTLWILPPAARLAEAPFSSIHRETFLAEWATLKDTLSFAALLRDYRVTRRHAFLLAEGGFTRYVDAQSVRPLLNRVAAREIPMETRVGNSACEQVHRSAVPNTDRRACLHLDETGIAAAWIVTIPTKSGTIQLLELHDANGGKIASISGARTEAGSQDEGWREALSQMPNPHWGRACA